MMSDGYCALDGKFKNDQDIWDTHLGPQFIPRRKHG
jgi:hypothetical protein